MRVGKWSFFDAAPHLLLSSAIGNDEFVCTLVVARLESTGWLAPRSHRVPAARSFTFAAAMRMIDRVHRNAAIVRALAQPALTSRLAERNVFVIAVADNADRRHTFGGNAANFTGRQLQE